MMKCSPLYTLFPTDEMLLASCKTIAIFMSNIQVNVILWFQQSPELKSWDHPCRAQCRHISFLIIWWGVSTQLISEILCIGERTSLINIILTSSRRGSIIVFATYPHNMQHSLLPYTPLPHPFLITILPCLTLMSFIGWTILKEMIYAETSNQIFYCQPNQFKILFNSMYRI